MTCPKHDFSRPRSCVECSKYVHTHKQIVVKAKTPKPPDLRKLFPRIFAPGA